jgi:multidrug resistance efflux pump
LFVHGGERVKPGDVLLTLRNDELQTQFVKVRNEISEKRKLVSALNAEVGTAEKSADRLEVVRIQGKIAETEIELKGLDEQRKLLEDRLERLTVRAPIDGVVTTFQADQELTSRPVSRGDLLLQVMDDRGDWRLEMEVQEQRLGHLLSAQRATEPALPIEFRLLTQPEKSYEATLTSLATRAETSETTGSVVEVRAALNTENLPQRAIGAEVRGRIHCGKKPLGYVLFGDVIEFVQRYLWW